MNHQDRYDKQAKEILDGFGGMFADSNDQSAYDELEGAIAAALRAEGERPSAEDRATIQCVVCEGPFTNYDEPCHYCFVKIKALIDEKKGN